MNRSPHRRPIPLYPYPPLPPHESSNDSDFPPIRVRESTPDPRHFPEAVPLQLESPQLRPHSESPNTRLTFGNSLTKNLNHLNTMNMTEHATGKNIPKSLSKRDCDSDPDPDPKTFDTADWPSKKRRPTFINDDDMDWLKDEVAGIKEYIKQIRMDLNIRLDELYFDIQQLASPAP